MSTPNPKTELTPQNIQNLSFDKDFKVLAIELLGYDSSNNQLVRVKTDSNGVISSSGGTYTNATPVPTTLGGIEAGSTFDHQTLQQMFDALLYPYQAPAFTAFTISGQTTPLEVGDSIAANRTFTWSTSNSSNVTANSIDILDVTGSATIISGTANDGTQATTYGAVTKNTATTNQFKIQGVNSQSTTFSRTYTVTWEWKVYYGESTTTPLAEADIEGLRVGGLQNGFAATYAYSTTGYKYLCYPAVLGTATTFTDTGTNLNVPFQTVYTVSVTNTFGVTTTYNVHRSTNIINAAINILVA